jgi:hypothetical protein
LKEEQMSLIRKTTIKDCEYTIKVLDGDSALIGFGVLAQYLAGPIGQLLHIGDSGNRALLGDAMRELGRALGSPDMRALAYTMLEGSTVTAAGQKKAMPLIADGNKELFKGHFAGKIGEELQLIWFAMKANYANFLDALPDLAELRRRLQNLAPVPSSQEGMTGESQG